MYVINKIKPVLLSIICTWYLKNMFSLEALKKYRWVFDFFLFRQAFVFGVGFLPTLKNRQIDTVDSEHILFRF